MALPDFTTQSAAVYKASIDATISAARAGTLNGVNAGGTANAQTLTLAEPLTAYVTYGEYSFIPVASNTSATVNLNINGLGNKLIKTLTGTGLNVGDLNTAGVAKVIYNGVDFILLNPATSSSAGAAFTPGLYGITSGTGVRPTYSYQTGWYKRVSGMMFISISLGLTAKGSVSGAIVLDNLPAAPLYAYGCLSIGMTDYITVASATYQLSARIDPGFSYVILTKSNINGGNYASLTDADIADNSKIIVSGLYAI